MSLRYFLEPNPILPERLRAVLLRGKKASVDEFLEFCTDGTTIARSDALAVLQRMTEWILARSKNGQEVDFGLIGQTRLGMKADISGYEDDIRKGQYQLTVGWQVSGELKRKVNIAAQETGIERRKARTRGPHITMVTDLNSNQPDVYMPGGVLKLDGDDLKFDEQRQGEGLFLKSGQGKEQRIQRYVEVRPKEVQAVVPKDIAGEQQLLLRTRGRAPGRKQPVEHVYEKTLRPAE